MEKIAYLGETILRWSVGPSTFLALPERGARLMNWSITHGDGTVRDVIYWPELTSLTDFPRIRGGNPILFPFCARTYDHGDINFWRAGDNIRRPMPQHGLARQGEFKLVRSDSRGFSALFMPDAAAQEAYPFDYEFTVNYRFESLALSCELTLKNHGRELLPWCPGHHFYFTLPWREAAKREDYRLHLAARERLKQNAVGLLEPGPERGSEMSIADPALLDALHTRLADHKARFGEIGKSDTVTVAIGTDSVPLRDATFVTWTASHDAPYFCVEPWMGPPNAPEHKRGLQWVRPGETANFSVSVSVR
jgi:galactose mutarotase-like enzyme